MTFVLGITEQISLNTWSTKHVEAARARPPTYGNQGHQIIYTWDCLTPASMPSRSTVIQSGTLYEYLKDDAVDRSNYWESFCRPKLPSTAAVKCA